MNLSDQVFSHAVIRKQIFFWVLWAVVMAGAWGCAPKPSKPVGQQQTEAAPEQVPAPKEEKTASLMEILLAEAENFSVQGNNQDALFVYNQALAQAGEKDLDTVYSGIEKVLAKTDPFVIQEFIQIKNIKIPRPLLIYWLGLNQAALGEYPSALRTFIVFLEEYPAHEYAPDAQDLLADIKAATFQKDTIGCLLPLSGKYEVYGQKALAGIQLAVQELSQVHGRPFKVVVKDSKSDPDQAALAVEELARENVMGIVGPLLTANLDAAGQKAQSLGVPLIALTRKSEFPLDGEYLFSNFITPEMQVQALASYVFFELGLEKVGILYPQERYGKRYMELFWDMADEYGGQVVAVEAYDGKKTDFSHPLKKLTGEYYPLPDFLKAEQDLVDDLENQGLEGDPKHDIRDRRSSAMPAQEVMDVDFEALFIPDSLSRVNLILPQLAFHDVKGMVLLGTNLWHQKSLLTQARGYNQNAVICDGYFGGSSNPVTSDFDARFKSLFHRTPGFLEAISYDTASILFSAALADVVDSREVLKDNLAGGYIFDGVTGRTIFDSSGRPSKELFLITVKQGRFEEIVR